MKIPKSKSYFHQAQKVLVGGVNSPVRSFRAVGGTPIFIDRGHGSKIYDVDGHVYTDYCLSWGALILGHAHRNVVLVTRKSINKGISYGTPTQAELDLAQEIVHRVPSTDLIRFVNSGTEASMSAVRLARGFTRRRMVVKFDGCYHGHVDDFLIKAGSGVAQLPESSSQGIPSAHIENTISLPYNNTDVLGETLERYHKDIACVILEPVAGNMGVIPATRGFLSALRVLTRKYHIILIFDECITGFRSHPGCFQAEVGIIPDMTCLGKIIGGGFPIGAYGGREDIMKCLAPLGGVYQAGTFSGNPVVMRAGLVTLRFLNADFYATLNQKAEELAKSLNAFFEEQQIPVHLSYFHSIMSLRFQKAPVRNYQEARKAAQDMLYAKLFHHLLDSGIYFPPADLESCFISGVHKKSDLNFLIHSLKGFFQSQAYQSQIPKETTYA